MVPARRFIFLVVTIAALTALGCDAFDPSALVPPNSDSMTDGNGEATDMGSAGRAAQGSPLPTRPRQPGMESIGPESATRVYYQFIDDAGRVQFVERLTDVPAQWRDRVGYVEMNQPPPLTPAAARKSWQLSAVRTAEILSAAARGQNRRAVNAIDRVGRGGDDEVVLYSATWCGYCTQARAHLDRENVDYEIRDVDIDAVARELREKTGRGGVPVLDFGGEVLRGYREEHYDRAIRAIRS